MSGILEALDAMYEIKDEIRGSEESRMSLDRVSSQLGHQGYRHSKKLEKKTSKEPYKPDSKQFVGPMRTAKDYKRRQGIANFSSKLECTETIDTLDGIL